MTEGDVKIPSARLVGVFEASVLVGLPAVKAAGTGLEISRATKEKSGRHTSGGIVAEVSGPFPPGKGGGDYLVSLAGMVETPRL